MDVAPTVLAASEIPAAPVLALMAFGVVVAVIGHAGKNMRAVAVGIGALFLATALMVVLGFAAYSDDSTDPRDCSTEPDYQRFCR